MSITLLALGRAHRSRGGKFARMADRQAPIHFGEKPLSMVWLDLANAIPEIRLDPSGFVITCSPAARAASAMIRAVAVFPFVPVTSAQPHVRSWASVVSSPRSAPLAVRGCLSVLKFPLSGGSTGGAPAGAKR